MPDVWELLMAEHIGCNLCGGSGFRDGCESCGEKEPGFCRACHNATEHGAPPCEEHKPKAAPVEPDPAPSPTTGHYRCNHCFDQGWGHGGCVTCGLVDYNFPE